MPPAGTKVPRRKVRGVKNKAAIDAVLDLIAVATPLHFAVVAGGICRQTWHKWTKQDPSLMERVEEAKCKAVAHCVAQIRAAALDPKHWTAAAWILERTYPEFFALHTTQTVQQIAAEAGEDVEFKVQFADGMPMPVVADEEEEAA